MRRQRSARPHSSEHRAFQGGLGRRHGRRSIRRRARGDGRRRGHERDAAEHGALEGPRGIRGGRRGRRGRRGGWCGREGRRSRTAKPKHRLFQESARGRAPLWCGGGLRRACRLKHGAGRLGLHWRRTHGGGGGPLARRQGVHGPALPAKLGVGGEGVAALDAGPGRHRGTPIILCAGPRTRETRVRGALWLAGARSRRGRAGRKHRNRKRQSKRGDNGKKSSPLLDFSLKAGPPSSVSD